MPTQSVKVKVYGTELSLRADNAERVLRAAAYVDGQMTLFHAKAPDQSTSTVAVLMALNVAEQIIVTEDSVRDCRKRVEALASALETAAAG
jgi:cell division protein ZapA (FtsZ GTPase activity inhibitor)